MKTAVAIIVLNWNGKRATTACLLSLRDIQDPDVEVIVIDNGSTDGSVSYFKEAFPEVTLVETGSNLGYAGGNNVGIAYALAKGATHLLLLNNDTVVDPKLVGHFLAGFANYPKAGVLGAKIYLMQEPTRLDHLGGIWRKDKVDFELVGLGAYEDGVAFQESIKVDYVCGAALMMKKEAIEKVGVLEERFFLFCEETDWCFRAKREGFEIRTCPEAKVWHEVSASLTGGKPHADYYAMRNRLLWIERNFTGRERLYYLSRLLRGSVVKTGKHFLLCQLRRGLKHLLGKRGGVKERLQIQRQRAILRGAFDYIFRRFGEAPKGLFTLK